MCRFCGRLLPLTYFPLKPGMKYARYKACRDCHPLGHSCIPKPKPEPKRRKFANDEERKAAQKEYQRQWHEQHREEMKAKRHERHELNKSRSANLTERFYCSCCRCIKPAEDFITNGKQFRVCNECRARHTKKQELGQKPKSPHGTGERCEYHRQYWLEHKEDIKATRVEQAINRERKAEKKEPEDKLCWKCWRWPCFEGIENMDSDFAKEGCQSFHMKEDAS